VCIVDCCCREQLSRDLLKQVYICTDIEAEVGDNGVRVVLQLQLEGQRGEPAHTPVTRWS
jgi:hypothetical protein